MLLIRIFLCGNLVMDLILDRDSDHINFLSRSRGFG